MSRGLELVGLGCTRGARTVLEGLDLVVPPGQIAGVVGPNGSGKSTLARCVGGELPCAGQVLLDGERVDPWGLARRVRRGLGYLPQEPSLVLALGPRANLRLRGASETEVADALRPWGAEAWPERPLAAASGGQRRMVELARTLLPVHRWLVLDEPSAALDEQRRAVLVEQVVYRARRGAAILWIDHHRGLLEEAGARILHLRGGRLED